MSLATLLGLGLPAVAHAEERAAGERAEGPTVFVASDSTAQSYTTDFAPQAGWGQLLDRYFAEPVTVANHAIGGRSSRTFVEEGRLDAILNEIRPGDYLFVQFGHNDATISRPDRYTSPADFKEYLREDYIGGALARGATPVVLTPVSRRVFDPTSGELGESFPEYAQAAREVAAEEGVPLLELGQASREYLSGVGPLESTAVFLHVPPGVYPNRPAGTIDETHFQTYGADRMARLIAVELAGTDLPLADAVVNTEPTGHRPARPDRPAASQVGHDGARLTWPAVANADLYRVEARRLDDRGRRELVAVAPIPVADVTGLAADTRYEVRVIAVNDRGPSAASRWLPLTTSAADLRLDFGTADSPVADGYLGVSPETVYPGERGLGFVATALPGQAIDRGPGTDDLSRDFVSSPGATYQLAVDVPDGVYTVSATVGDPAGASRTGFVLEGSDRGQVIGYPGAVTPKTFTQVTVADGRLDLSLYGETGHLNSLVLSRTS
ncbi:GDSL-type esterase/lipase family protein [Streptomyces sp. DSM 44915]|uniref:GDSL-type esterase/lipase family protein n=1 Tax=Streptomyces chisholmiae TaxID=3075540 RepID=A0ABU2JN89_9ACTN|nr:GDSL-type esterase/lipase family protein [Streptomyces sp. DSM 44915]MDT0266442.1 GDSL-type esterase/lipase family protein [Streptomyces sp. DSM 44915]